MATNFTLAEAAKIVREGKDYEAIQEIGKRFPFLFASLIKMMTKAEKEFSEFVECIPDYLTANKMNGYIKAKVLSDESDEDASEEKNETAKPEKQEKKKAEKKPKKQEVEEEDSEDEEETESDYDSMTTSKLWDLVKSRPEAKKHIKGNAKKAELIEALKKADAEGGSDAEEDDDAESEETTGYSDMSALELFKECKRRGIKATPKKKEKYYIELLEKDDASKAESDDDDDDDWDDDEEPEVKPSKKEKKSKPAPKAEPEDDDDDDDWDI